MLTELRIHNFAIIDQLDLRFGSGLIILTGETGAGKSIILDAVVMLIQLLTGNLFGVLFQVIYLVIAVPVVYSRLSGIQLFR